MNHYIVFLLLSLIAIFIIKKLCDLNESFDINNKLEEINSFEKKQQKLKTEDTNRLKKIIDDSSLFSQFCNKIKYFDDNYDSSSKIKMFTKYSKKNIINQLKKKQEKLFKQLFDLQEKIYFNKKDVENHQKYEQLIDEKTKQYIKVIDKAIENLKKNLNNKLILNINK